VVLVLCGCGSSATPSDGGGGGGGTGGGGGADAAASVGADTGLAADTSPAPDQGSMMMTGKSVDECFVGLRALEGSSQDATRASADGKYKMRLALETADRGGTSGSYAWAAVRFALQTPDGNVCITDEAALGKTYMGSHHNCMDVLTVNSGGHTYAIQNPDSASDYVDKTKWRRNGSLTISMGGTMTAGPITLLTTRCNSATCASGGPCQ
jgi:hypothetical protein